MDFPTDSNNVTQVKMVDFPDIFSYVHAVLAVTGMFFNATLAYLALFQTPKVIRSYSTLIINFACTDFFACFFDLFVQQRIIPTGVSLGYISNGYCKYLGPTACYVGYSLMMHCLAHSLWLLLLSFSYRYYILFKPTPSRKTLMLCVAVIYTPSCFQWISFLWAQDEPDEIRAILHESFPQYNLTGYTISGSKTIICFSALYTALHMTLPVTPVYTCILILRKKIITRLSHRGINISKDTKHIHAQLLMALTYQAAIPGFYLFSVISYAVGQLNIYNHPFLEYFTFSSMLFIPLLSPLASFIFVTPYRHFIRRKFFRITKMDIGESSSFRYNATNQISMMA